MLQHRKPLSLARPQAVVDSMNRPTISLKYCDMVQRKIMIQAAIWAVANMNITNKAPVYASVDHGNNVTSNTRSSRPKSRKRLHDYRPIPLRFPFLFSFVTLSAIYIILIEVLLHHAKNVSVDAAESTKLSQRLLARQGSALSTRTVTVTSTSSVQPITITVIESEYTTIHSSGYTGTAATTITLSPSLTSTSSVSSTSSRPSVATSTTRSLSVVTSGLTSYYATTVTVIVAQTAVFTITSKILGTVLIFDKPTSTVVPSSSNSPASNSISFAIMPNAPYTGTVGALTSDPAPTQAPEISNVLSFSTADTTLSPSQEPNFSTLTRQQSSLTMILPSSSNPSTAVLSAQPSAPSSRSLIDTSDSMLRSVTATDSTGLSTLPPVTTILDSSALTIMRPSASSLNSMPSTIVAPSSLVSTYRPITQIPDSYALTLTKSGGTSTQLRISNSQISDGSVQATSYDPSRFLTISTLPTVSLILTGSTLVSTISSASSRSTASGPISIAMTATRTTFLPNSSSFTQSSLPTPSNSTTTSFSQSNLTSSISAKPLSTNSSSTSVRSTPASTTPLTTSANATSTSAAPSEPPFVLASTERLVQGDFNIGYYVSSLYVPALLAILLKILWEVVYSSTRLIQPFERMATPKGVSGRYSLFAQYLSSSLSWDVIRAISHGNPIPLLAELSYILVQIGTPIATISTTIRPRSYCNSGGSRLPCDPVWIVDVPLLRVIEGILAVCLLCIVAILFVRARHRSGIDTDPSSLGSVATITNEKNLIKSMQACAIDNDPVLFEQLLRRRHFRLADYADGRALPRYGIVSQKGPVTIPGNRNSIQAQPGYHTISETGVPLPDDPMLTSAPRAPILSPAREAFLLDLFGLLTPFVLLTIVVAFALDGDINDAWNRFFLTNSVWPKLLLVGLATVSSLLMTNIERIVRSIEPFRRLNANAQAGKSAPPVTTLLVSRSGTAYSTFLQCIALIVKHEHRGGRMMFQSLVAFTVIVSDLNIVAVAGIAWTQATTQASFDLSMKFSLAFTSFIIFVWLIVIFWWRRHHAVRALRASNGAGTVAGTMRYISCGSVNTVAELARIYEEWCYLGSRSRMGRQWSGYRAVFGQYPCDDGKVRWCVALQKLAEAIDEMQDAGQVETRVKYY